MAHVETTTRRLSRTRRPASDAPTRASDPDASDAHASDETVEEAVAAKPQHRIFEHQQVIEPIGVTLATPLVRFGLASILIVNALAALVDPDGFEGLITGNILGESMPSVMVRALVMLVATNDLALGGALISGWRPQIVYRWMALWFIAIASLKLLSFL